MNVPGLRQQFTAVLMTLLIVLGGAILTSVIFVIRQHTYKTVATSLDDDTRTFQALHKYHATELKTRAELLATEPKITAALGTPDIDRSTVLHLTRSIRKAGELDLLMIGGSDHWPPAVSIQGETEPRIDSSVLLSGFSPDFSFWELFGRDLFMVSVPVEQRGVTLGHIAIGEFTDTTYFSHFKDLIGSQIILCATDDAAPQDQILAATWPLEKAAAFMGEFGSPPARAFSQPVRVDPETLAHAGLARAVSLNGRIRAILFTSLAPADAAITAATKSTIFIVLILLTGSYVVIRHMTRTIYTPIQKLADGTARIASGQFDARVLPAGPSEIRELGDSFNSMAEDLGRLNQSELESRLLLEQRVAQRTAELEKSNRLLIEANEKIKSPSRQIIQVEKLAGIGTLAAGVAHELNNPLAVISGNAELMANVKRDDADNERLNTIIRHSNRAADIVKRMLRFARKQKAERSACDIHELIDTSLELIRYNLKHAPIEIERRYDRALPRISADEGAIEQVLVNVITNAFQAMQAAHGRGTLTIETAQAEQPEFLRVCIEDDGPGIPDQVQKRIFDPFYTTKGIGKGTGLGLSVAHGIIADHGGRIYLERSGPAGTAFAIELPVGRNESQTKPARAAAIERVDGEQTRSMMVVDDEDDIRSIIRLFMEAEKYRVYEASSARDALDALAELDDKPQILFVDVRMPDMDGVEFHREVTRIYGPDIAGRIVFVTGDTLSPDIQTVLNRTNCPTVIKPFRAQDLHAAARKILAARKNRPPE